MKNHPTSAGRVCRPLRAEQNDDDLHGIVPESAKSAETRHLADYKPSRKADRRCFPLKCVYIDDPQETGDYDVRFKSLLWFTTGKNLRKGLRPMSNKVCLRSKFY